MVDACRGGVRAKNQRQKHGLYFMGAPSIKEIMQLVEISESKSCKLDLEILKKIPLLSNVNTDDLRFKKIVGGTNKNYILALGEEFFILRIPGENTASFSRRNEFYNQAEAARIGITEPNIFFEKNTGLQLRRYIKSTENIDVGKVNTIKKVVATLKTLHGSHAKFNNTLTGFDRLDSLEDSFVENRKYLKSNCKDLIEKTKIINEILNNACFEKVPCHNDAHPMNFVYSKGNIKLIDWETSGNNDPAWDMAYFIIVGGLNEKQEALFLHLYECNYQMKNRIVVLKPIVQLFIAKWLFVKQFQVNQQYRDQFSLLIDSYFDSLRKSLHSAEFRECFKLIDLHSKNRDRGMKKFSI